MKLNKLSDEVEYIKQHYYEKTLKELSAELERSHQFIKARIHELFVIGALRPKRPGKLKVHPKSYSFNRTYEGLKGVTRVREILFYNKGTLKKHAFVVREDLVLALQRVSESLGKKYKQFLEEALVVFLGQIYETHPFIVEEAFKVPGNLSFTPTPDVDDELSTDDMSLSCCGS